MDKETKNSNKIFKSEILIIIVAINNTDICKAITAALKSDSVLLLPLEMK